MIDVPIFVGWICPQREDTNFETLTSRRAVPLCIAAVRMKINSMQWRYTPVMDLEF